MRDEKFSRECKVKLNSCRDNLNGEFEWSRLQIDTDLYNLLHMHYCIIIFLFTAFIGAIQQSKKLLAIVQLIYESSKKFVIWLMMSFVTISNQFNSPSSIGKWCLHLHFDTRTPQGHINFLTFSSVYRYTQQVDSVGYVVRTVFCKFHPTRSKDSGTMTKRCLINPRISNWVSVDMN